MAASRKMPERVPHGILWDRKQRGGGDREAGFFARAARRARGSTAASLVVLRFYCLRPPVLRDPQGALLGAPRFAG